MFHHESWKPIYFWVKRSKVKIRLTRLSPVLSVFRHNAMLLLAAYISNGGFSLLLCPFTQAMLETLGFPCIRRDRRTVGCPCI